MVGIVTADKGQITCPIFADENINLEFKNQTFLLHTLWFYSDLKERPIQKLYTKNDMEKILVGGQWTSKLQF